MCASRINRKAKPNKNQTQNQKRERLCRQLLLYSVFSLSLLAGLGDLESLMEKVNELELEKDEELLHKLKQGQCIGQGQYHVQVQGHYKGQGQVQ